MPAFLDDPAVVEHDDLVGVANGREAVGDRDRRRPSGVVDASCTSRSVSVSRPRSPRRARGSAGCADRPGDRDALISPPESGSRARRRPCRSPPAARRSRGGSARPSAAASTSSSVASGLAKRRFSRTDDVEEVRLLRPTPTNLVNAPNLEVANVEGLILEAPDVVEPHSQIAERCLPGAGLADERRRRPVPHRGRYVLQRPVLVVAEPHVVEADVARPRRSPARWASPRCPPARRGTRRSMRTTRSDVCTSRPTPRKKSTGKKSHHLQGRERDQDRDRDRGRASREQEPHRPPSTAPAVIAKLSAGSRPSPQRPAIRWRTSSSASRNESPSKRSASSLPRGRRLAQQDPRENSRATCWTRLGDVGQRLLGRCLSQCSPRLDCPRGG